MSTGKWIRFQMFHIEILRLDLYGAGGFELQEAAPGAGRDAESGDGHDADQLGVATESTPASRPRRKGDLRLFRSEVTRSES
jgi:hypothetical protein